MVISIPGPTPPINILPTEALANVPYMTMVTLGGMIRPIVPEEATTAAVKALSYLCCSMPGTITAPMADVVAGAEPEIAPKNMEETVATWARPPGRRPTIVDAISVRRFETPPRAITLPAKTKNGIARSVKESMARKVF